MKLAKQIANFSSYAKELGVRAAFDLSRIHNRREASCVRVKGFDPPLWCRGGTSDVSMLRVVIGRDSLKIKFKAPPKLIVDAGANVGYFTRLYANRFPAAKIISIEPEPSNYEMLRKNTTGLSRVVPVNAALWWRHEKIAIRNPTAANASFQVTSSLQSEQVEVASITLPDIIAEHGDIDFLKIDIEGAELPLFQNGAEQWLPQVGVLAIELHERHAPGCTEAIQQAVKPLNAQPRDMREYLVYDLKNMIQ